MVHVAVCYWGLTRTLATTHVSHEKHIYNILSQNNITYDKYIHTWRVPESTFDYSEYAFKGLFVEDQSSLIKEIDEDFSEYWYEHIFRENCGDSPYEWYPEAVKRGLYSMASLKRVTQLCIDSGVKYDYIIYVRPDCMIYSDLSPDFIHMDNDSIVCPREHYGSKDVFGINDIWCIIPYNKCKEYAFRFDETKFYRKNIGRLAVEHYVGWIVQKYFKNIIYSDVVFDLRR
jgi:hypothetical protein